jgi:hypothetical protein
VGREHKGESASSRQSIQEIILTRDENRQAEWPAYFASSALINTA